MLKLRFKVDPKALAEDTYIEDPVKIVICDPKAMLLKGILGNSGMLMAEAGFAFYFEKDLAMELISEGISKEV